jgi:L-seryl-tRNA(Ser) seleniumtransferase
LKSEQSARLRLLPPVAEIVAELQAIPDLGRKHDLPALTWSVRSALARARRIILDRNGEAQKVRIQGEEFWEYPPEQFSRALRAWLKQEASRNLHTLGGTLQRMINATGVVLHTNLGRAPLAPEIAGMVEAYALAYSNLEFDLETGDRGSRYAHLEALLTELTGAEAALAVNNNAAAVLLIMNTFANQKEVIVSRGELVEVGGSFRIPEVLKAGGAKLVEVGATNKTWLEDYREAVNGETALILKVHTSNYRIEGFQHTVDLADLVKLGAGLNIPVVEDLGSGSFLDGTEFGLPKEPTIQETVNKGAALVSFSGDKLLGGPQAGIIVGQKELIAKIKKNQLLRALRLDKLTLTALVGTLRLYQRGEVFRIPVWRMLGKKREDLRQEAQELAELLAHLSKIKVTVEENFSRVGGGAFPTAQLPTFVCAVQVLTKSAAALERFLRRGQVPILARIERDKLLFDPRTLWPEDFPVIAARLALWEQD